MKKFDVLVVGTGSGLSVAWAAAGNGLKTAIVEEGQFGGTCLNRGCIPSKMVIHSADIAEEIMGSSRFGINSKGYSVDLAKITGRASNHVDVHSKKIEKAALDSDELSVFKGRAKFVGERTVEVNGERIMGEKIVIAAGTRPSIPPIEGLDKVKYMTSDEALRLGKQPKSMIILGGGFIAAEMAHFFGALGTKVTIIQRSTLLKNEDGEVSRKFTEVFSRKHGVVLGYTVKKVEQKAGKITIHAESGDGKEKSFSAESLLVATGRTPNSDVLEVEKAGVMTDKDGYIKTNEYLETTARNVWAFGDIAGKYLLKHSANLEAQYIMHNALGGATKSLKGRKEKRLKVDYWPMGHAVFSSPQIASAGFTEEQLKEKGADYVVGKLGYESTAMGSALDENNGFAKLLVDRKTRKILGCHIIGPEAATLIHEVLVVMKAGLAVDIILDTVHIHPAMSEIIQRAAWKIG